MKTLKILASTKKVFFTSLLVALFASATMANPGIRNEDKADKTTEKAREAVSKASPHDWFALAEAAEKCIARGVNLKQAGEWLDRSLEIKETSYNLNVKGDYFMANRLPEKALEYYVKSIAVGKEENTGFDVIPIQKKISAIIFKK
jgi:hypothetical protein